jgi:transposase
LRRTCLIQVWSGIDAPHVRSTFGAPPYPYIMTERAAYPSDLPDARRALIEPRLSAWRRARTDAGVGGRAASHDLREIFNAVLYVNRTGIAWRYLPHDLPPWQTVDWYFQTRTDDGIFTDLNYDLDGPVRNKSGRTTTPTASILDTQSVKTSTSVATTTQGIDAGKRIVGRNRGIVTDTLGLLLAVIVTAASVSANTFGVDLLDQATAAHPTVTKTWVDAGFKKTVIEHGATLGVDVETVTKNPQVKGFSVIKRRWVVERAIGWLMQHRRLARDYETLPATSAIMIRIAMIDNFAKRATGETTSTWRDT